LLTIVGALVGLVGCLIPATSSPHTEPSAELVVVVGRIWTGDPSRPWAQAIASRDGRIEAVGSRDEIRPWIGPDTKVIDLPDAFATAGLIDAHGHMSSLGSKIDELDLRGVDSIRGVADLVAKRIADRPGDGWIIGQSWDQSLWASGAFPRATDLDSASLTRPVWLKRVDGHAGWANSAAMKAAGVSRSTSIPSDGQMIVDSEGEPTGVFVDGAMSLIDRVVPPAKEEDIERWLLAAQEEVVRLGLTGVHDAGISQREVEVYRRLDASGRLKLRIHAMASPPAGRELEFVSKGPELDPNGRFKLRAIKLFADGAMGSRGALMSEAYADDPGNRGLSLIDREKLWLITERALQTGWQVCTHAIGDRANTIVLDAYLAAMAAVPDAEDPRLRIEHAQVVNRLDVERFAKGRIIASMQPSHASTDQRWADARLGPERVLGAYAWR
jgi:predicted amidohydrolase YtcJ